MASPNSIQSLESKNINEILNSQNDKIINVGTRKSALAMIQAEIVHSALKNAHPELEFRIHGMATIGDKDQVTALSKIGSKALWTSELEAQLLDGKLDMVIHCLKDMPTKLPEKCMIGCIMEREDPRDVLIMKKYFQYTSLKDLPSGAVVGTSSLRRSAQIKRLYPHLRIKDVRGNVGTRLDKLDKQSGEYWCLILAAAGIKRMGWQERITAYLDSETDDGYYYAVGQGALAVEIREGDDRILNIVNVLTDQRSTLETTSERSLMRTLEGGCSVPIGVESAWTDEKRLFLIALVVSLDGKKSVKLQMEGQVVNLSDAEKFGQILAYQLIANGAGKILDEIKNSNNSESSSN